MRIVFFKGVLDTTDLFVDQLIESCKKREIDYYVFDVNDDASLDVNSLVTFITEDGCVVLTFNMIGVTLSDPQTGENIWEKYCIPVYSWLVDHPRSFRSVCERPLSCLRLLCVDRDYVRFIRRWYPDVQCVYFLPHGGTGIGNRRPFSQRKYGVIYVGDCSPDVSLPVIPFIENAEAFYRDVISVMLQETSLPTEEAIDRVLLYRKYDFGSEQLKYLHFDCAGYIWCIVRREFQLRSIYSLDKAGIRVEIFGTPESWISDKYAFSKNVVFYGRVSPYSCLEIMSDSKYLLNNMLGLKNGSHERVYNSQLSRMVCISDESSYLYENRKNGKDILFYDLNNMDEMVSTVMWCLENDSETEMIAERGFETANNNDSWDNRFSEFLNILSLPDQN